MRFFADENFIRQAIDLLKAYDNQRNTFSHLLEHFERGTADVVWLSEVARWNPKPIILSGDGRILRNAVERAALRSSGCTYVFLGARLNQYDLGFVWTENDSVLATSS